jgi:hypothetical protein
MRDSPDVIALSLEMKLGQDTSALLEVFGALPNEAFW